MMSLYKKEAQFFHFYYQHSPMQRTNCPPTVGSCSPFITDHERSTTVSNVFTDVCMPTEGGVVHLGSPDHQTINSGPKPRGWWMVVGMTRNLMRGLSVYLDACWFRKKSVGNRKRYQQVSKYASIRVVHWLQLKKEKASLRQKYFHPLFIWWPNSNRGRCWVEEEIDDMNQ